MFLTKQEARNEYNKGSILENRNQVDYVFIFRLCGFDFTSTKRRTRRNKHYKLDDPFWKIHSTNSLMKKLKLIYNKEVRLLK